MDQMFINLKKEVELLQEQFDTDLVSVEELKDKFIDCLYKISDLKEETEYLEDKYKQLEYEVQEYYIPRKIDMENGELI